MTRIPFVVIALVLALAAASGGHLVWGDYAPDADTIIWGTLGDTGDTIVWGG